MSTRSEALVDALQDALGAEHAAVYAYGTIGGRLDAKSTPQRRAAGGYRTHLARRDQLTAQIAAAGADPVAAEPVYDMPTTVETSAQAAAVALQVEDRCAVFYARVIAAASGKDRTYALGALTDCATRSLSWGAVPSALPGVERP